MQLAYGKRNISITFEVLKSQFYCGPWSTRKAFHYSNNIHVLLSDLSYSNGIPDIFLQ
jgi:hypothetical protein